MPVRLPEKFSPFSLREQLWRDFRSAYNDVKRVLDEITQFRDNAIKAVNGIPNLVRNVLINGDFNIWQAGTSWTGVTTTTHLADMWKQEVYSQGTWNITRVTDVPTEAQAGRRLNYAIRAEVTTADVTVGTGSFAMLVAETEGYDYAPLYKQPKVIRFWVKSNKTGTYCLALRSGVNDFSYVTEFTIDAADTWELKTFSIPAESSGGTWDFTNGRGLRISITYAAGSTFQTTPNSWQSGNFLGTASIVNLADTVGNYIQVTDVRLVAGQDASNIYIPSIAEQLAMCQRYYEVSNCRRIAGVTYQPNGDSRFNRPWKVPKRANPTVSYTGSANVIAQGHSGAVANVNLGTLTLSGDTDSFWLSLISNYGAFSALGTVFSWADIGTGELKVIGDARL